MCILSEAPWLSTHLANRANCSAQSQTSKPLGAPSAGYIEQ